MWAMTNPGAGTVAKMSTLTFQNRCLNERESWILKELQSQTANGSLLVPNDHQMAYHLLSPFIQSSNRQVRLKRRGNTPLGFSIRGGCEHGTGIFVSDVQLGSEAHKQGLMIGDQILRINGFGVEHAVHDEVIALLKSSPSLVLKVKSVGVIPVKDNKQDPLTWKVVDPGPSPNGSVGDGNSSSGASSQDDCLEAKVFISLAGASGLGCTVVKGPPEMPGIFVQTVKPGGIAQQAGLEVGDQIVDMNGISFATIEFAEAIALLKSSPDMTVTVKKRAGLDLFSEEKIRRYRTGTNGVISNGDIVTTAVVHAEDERSNRTINHVNGSTLHRSAARKPSSGSESCMSLQTSVANGSVSVSERDVSISEVETEPGRREIPRPVVSINGHLAYRNGTKAMAGSSCSDTDSYKSSDTEVGQQISDIYHVSSELKSRLSLDSEEEREKRQREEERLVEERRKLEEEQRRLKEEAEKLAEEKRKWEEEKKQLESTIRPPPIFPPQGRNFLAEMMEKAEKRNNDCSAGVINGTLKLDEARLRKTGVLGGEKGKNEASTLKRKQHEMLMQEFQVAHRKMFGNSGKKPEATRKTIENKENKKNEETFRRRQQVPASAPAPPPPSETVSSPSREKNVIFQTQTIGTTKQQHENKEENSKKAQPNGTTSVPEKKIPPLHKPVVICPKSPEPTPKPLITTSNQDDEETEHPEFPITDSRGHEPKPPPTFFDTISLPKKGGPLVTIGTYTNTCRQNRFVNESTNGNVIRPRPVTSESGSDSPLSSTSSSPTPNRPKPQLTISISSKSSVSSSSVNSSPRSEPKSPLNGYNGSMSSEPQSPVSFRVTSRTHGSEQHPMNGKTGFVKNVCNGSPTLKVSVNSKPVSQLKNAESLEKVTNQGNGGSQWIKSKVVTISQNGHENGKNGVESTEDESSESDMGIEDVKVYMIDKMKGPLNIRLEGGLNSQHNGKIMIADIWEGGCIPVDNRIKKGDQLLMIDNTRLSHVSLTFANAILEGAMTSSNKQLKLTVAKIPLNETRSS